MIGTGLASALVGQRVMAHSLSLAFSLLPVLSSLVALLALALVSFVGACSWAWISTGIRDARIATIARASMATDARMEAVTAYGKQVRS